MHYLCDPPPEGCADLKALLGGKGASLKEMCRAGLRVPPGFTVSTGACARYFDGGRTWPEGLEAEVRANLARLEGETGRRFGRGSRPLLVSVRSGAAVSMPGMMDTLLNCGLHPGLADDVGDTPAFWTAYLQFIRRFARTARAVDADAFAEAQPPGPAPPDRASAEAHLRIYREQTGEAFPTKPYDTLAACINAVFDSWHSERAVAYRRRNDIRGLAGTAVTVQMMFPSQVSGIVFTQDPNNLRANRMLVEASYGLGEAVVSGNVTPDRFIVGRDDLSDIRTELGHKTSVVSALGDERDLDPDAPSLTARQVGDLCRLCLKIEAHFGHPVDVEWGWADGAFAVLQARAIRGLDVVEDVEIGREEEIRRLRALAGGRRRVWMVHNLAETLRAPTPLTWDVVRRFMTGDGGFGRMYQQLGYRPSAAARAEGVLELVGGRIYADPERLAGMFWGAMPLTYGLDALLADKSLLDHAPTTFDPTRADERFLVGLPSNLVAMYRAGRRLRRARRDARRAFEEDVLPPYLEYVRATRGQDLSALSDEAVVAELDRRRARVLDGFGPESLKAGLFGGMAFDALARRLMHLMGPDDGEALASRLTRGLEGDTTFEQDALLWDVAMGEATIAEFLERFGHRSVGEMELAEPRWREDPAYLAQMIARYRSHRGRSPAEIHRENVARREEAEKELPAALKHWGGSCFREPIEADLADAQALLPYRESGKHYLMMGYELLRTAIEELAARWGLGGGIYFLRLDELGALPRDRARPARRARPGPQDRGGVGPRRHGPCRGRRDGHRAGRPQPPRSGPPGNRLHPGLPVDRPWLDAAVRRRARAGRRAGRRAVARGHRRARLRHPGGRLPGRHTADKGRRDRPRRRQPWTHRHRGGHCGRCLTRGPARAWPFSTPWRGGFSGCRATSSWGPWRSGRQPSWWWSGSSPPTRTCSAAPPRTGSA
ncbi:MAG: hypothetical protein AMS14_11975 [Planctomycetes bacterium DG_20]|nr:MAG: hypothetical protein AMS14_11975 [Planctomycetes bacterium DG_20]